jgi:hypothetical protein
MLCSILQGEALTMKTLKMSQNLLIQLQMQMVQNNMIVSIFSSICSPFNRDNSNVQFDKRL